MSYCQVMVPTAKAVVGESRRVQLCAQRERSMTTLIHP